MNSWRLSSHQWPVSVRKLDAGEPLLLRRAHFAREGVQVLDQIGHDFLEPRIGRALDTPQDLGGERFLGECANGHRMSSFGSLCGLSAITGAACTLFRRTVQSDQRPGDRQALSGLAKISTKSEKITL
jgi:hypothetical protein